MFPNLTAALGMFFTTITAIFSGTNEFAEAFEKSGKIVNDKAAREYNRHKAEMDAESIEQKAALSDLRATMKAKRQAQLDAKAS
jgi:hypothetical protein